MTDFRDAVFLISPHQGKQANGFAGVLIRNREKQRIRRLCIFFGTGAVFIQIDRWFIRQPGPVTPVRGE